MSRYDPDFKVKIVAQNLYGNEPITRIARKHKIPKSLVREWCLLAKYNGLSIFHNNANSRNRSHSAAFRLKVVKYYKTHDEGTPIVAAKFNISGSQMRKWNRDFDNLGYVGLFPRRRGANSIKPRDRKTKEIKQNSLPESERQSYKSEIIRLRKELYDAKIDQLILKELRTMGYFQTK